jgi:D-alanyl-D-alanine carboxypeptidase (penicillin-binding protein 5/6)
LTTTQTRLNVQLNETSLTAPLEKIMHLAKVNVYQDNQLIQSFDIEDEVHIEQASWFERLMEWIKSIFGI